MLFYLIFVEDIHFGKYDRAKGERKTFGKIRYMRAAGLKRKCGPVRYIKKVNKMQKEASL